MSEYKANPTQFSPSEGDLYFTTVAKKTVSTAKELANPTPAVSYKVPSSPEEIKAEIEAEKLLASYF